MGQLFTLPARSVSPPSAQRIEAVVYIVCYILIEASYFVNIGKSQCVPSTVVRFLGFLCDSLRQSFLIPPDKKAKFRSLRESILPPSLVNLNTLQRFMGKVVSFSLAIPGFKLYVCEVFSAIAELTRSSKVVAKVQGGLRSDIQCWRFLDDWSDCLHQRSDKHCIVTLFCDASKGSWGGVLLKDGKRIEPRDYWPDSLDDINSLFKALFRSLLAFRDHIHNPWLDVYTDNQTFKAALENSGCKSLSTNQSQRFCGVVVFPKNICFVPSRGNPADTPSQVCSDLNCMLSTEA